MMNIIERLIEDSKFAKKMSNILKFTLTAFLIFGILINIRLINFLRFDLGLFLIGVAITITIIYLLGSNLFEYRIALIRRSVVEYYRKTPNKSTENIEEEIDEAARIYTLNYVTSHIKISIGTMLSLFLIFMDGFLMSLFNLTTFHFLGFTIFRDVGIIGMFLIILYFYRSYAEDPQQTLYENMNNFRRVSATGRKDLV